MLSRIIMFLFVCVSLFVYSSENNRVFSDESYTISTHYITSNEHGIVVQGEVDSNDNDAVEARRLFEEQVELGLRVDGLTSVNLHVNIQTGEISAYMQNRNGSAGFEILRQG